jgi:ADP-ribose pyrophosphatase
VKIFPVGEQDAESVAIRQGVWYSEIVMQTRDESLLWRERSRQKLASCSLFDMFSSERSSAQGKTGRFCILTAPDWVNVVPVLARSDGDAFLMVRQYRHGASLITTEFPAGLVEPGEDPARAATRELEEETGFRAGKLTPLGRVSPNPAFMNNWCFTFLAEGLTRVGDLALDELEDLDVLQVPVADLPQRIGTGELINSLSLVAFFLYQRRAAGVA